MSARNHSFRSLSIAVAAVLTLSACERPAPQTAAAPPAPAPGRDDLAVMREALQRNPQLEVLASDAQSQVFTVRDKQTGAVQAVKVSELAAAPIAQLTHTAAPPAPPSEPAAPSPPAQTPAAPNPPAARAPAQSASASQGAGATPNYTIERNAGQLRVTGPGVSIVSSGEGNAPSEADARRSSEPIICEGQRMVHFDNRNLYVEGDAITVRDGCELFITNSNIRATGVGVNVQNGVVHVSNSQIEGGEASFVADAQARMFVRGSSFTGVSRRDERALVQDQGGNRWR